MTPLVRTEPLLRLVLGDILRRARQAQGRTLKDVSLDAQVSMPYLSEVERGLKEASSEVLAAICQALDLTVADLLALAYGELAPIAALDQHTVTSQTHLAPISPAGVSEPGSSRAMLCAA
jgi:transcriptional regulator with XRE-family HTH domain